MKCTNARDIHSNVNNVNTVKAMSNQTTVKQYKYAATNV